MPGTSGLSLKRQPINNTGFTLLEILLYISLTAVLLVAMVAMIALVMDARVKNRAILEVEEQGSQLIRVVTGAVKNAVSINSPVTSTSAGLLSLNMTSTTINPTVFDVSGGTIRVKEGVGALVNLTNSRVSISGLSFSNYSRSGTPGIVTFSFILGYTTSTARNEYEYKQNFYGSASLR